MWRNLTDPVASPSSTSFHRASRLPRILLDHADVSSLPADSSTSSHMPAPSSTTTVHEHESHNVGRVDAAVDALGRSLDPRAPRWMPGSAMSNAQTVSALSYADMSLNMVPSGRWFLLTYALHLNMDRVREVLGSILPQTSCTVNIYHRMADTGNPVTHVTLVSTDDNIQALQNVLGLQVDENLPVIRPIGYASLWAEVENYLEANSNDAGGTA
jgi:hypothetical protein